MTAKADRVFLVTMLLLDLAMVGLALALAYWVRFHSGWIPYNQYHAWTNYLLVGLVQTALLPPVFGLQGLYRLRRGPSRFDEIYRLVIGLSIVNSLNLAFISLVTRENDVSRLVQAMTWGFSIVLIWVGRMLHYAAQGELRKRGFGRQRVLVVGTGQEARIIGEKILGAPELGYELVGYVTTNGTQVSGVAGKPVVGRVDELNELIRKYQVGEVIVAEPGLSHRDILEVVARCEPLPVNIKVYPDVFQIMASEVSIGDFNGLPMVNIRDVGLRGWRRTVKRAFDVVFSATVLILFSPLMLLIAALIKLTSPDGPVFYVQERVGLDGKPFPIIKFRTMRPDAEAETGPVWTKPGDPRRTRLGAILRRFSLDELPQFINVLLGHMSVVGPRPERPYFVQQFAQVVPRYLDRHREKAGITGWAQVNGLRGDTPIEERTAYDLWYVENWTLWLDIKIILRTILQIFRDKNAY
ncbi:MAG: undecaprenyl-phosphate glucose phosphotransferase [Chloroflexota bacterium]